MKENDIRGRFVWYDLMTSDPAAGQTFYGKVAGWGLQPLADPLAQSAAPKHEQRHVGAQARAQRHEFFARQIQLPKPVQHQQHRRCVGGAAAESAAGQSAAQSTAAQSASGKATPTRDDDG